MLKSIKNLKLYENIDYVHESDDEIYRDTFDNVLNENLIYHGKSMFLKQLRVNYPDLAKYHLEAEFTKHKEMTCLFRLVLEKYTVEEIDEIINRYSYTVSKVSGDYVILRPINNYQQKYTNWYFHLSTREDLGIIGIETKSSPLSGFEKYDGRIYLYPFFSLICNEDNALYDSIKDKAKEVADKFNDIRKTKNKYYVYAIHLPKKFPICRDTSQSKDYAVYVRNDIPASYVYLVGNV